MATCLTCGKATAGTNLCSLCANTLPADSTIWNKVTVDYTGGAATARAATPVAITMFLEDATKVQPSSHPALAGHIAEWVGLMSAYLDSRRYWDAQSETSVGDQHTPHGCKVDTASLDFQGVRSGTEGTFWIDLQGQVGGGSTGRYTFCQVLIQTRLGGPVPQDRIAAGLVQSLRGGSKRAVIHQQGGTGRPK